MASYNMDIKAGPVLECFGALFTLNFKNWSVASTAKHFNVNLQVVLSFSFELRIHEILVVVDIEMNFMYMSGQITSRTECFFTVRTFPLDKCDNSGNQVMFHHKKIFEKRINY
jgi:hypothetical protein